MFNTEDSARFKVECYRPMEKNNISGNSKWLLNVPQIHIKKSEEEKDNVNHPAHYNKGKIEVIDYIEDKELNFNLGNAIKYISRCNHKGKKIEDIEKAIWYLEREIRER